MADEKRDTNASNEGTADKKKDELISKERFAKQRRIVEKLKKIVYKGR